MEREKMKQIDADRIFSNWSGEYYLCACDELKGEVLEGLNLSRIDFKQADLTATKFVGCNLYKCDFEDCYLGQTIFEDCFMLDVKFKNFSNCLFIHNDKAIF